MTRDKRWIDVFEAADSAIRHFQGAAEIFRDGWIEAKDGLAGYRDLMALLHAMQSGYTSFEVALVRTMEIMDEERPSGSDWHSKLVARSDTGPQGRYHPARPRQSSP